MVGLLPELHSTDVRFIYETGLGGYAVCGMDKLKIRLYVVC